MQEAQVLDPPPGVAVHRQVSKRDESPRPGSKAAADDSGSEESGGAPPLETDNIDGGGRGGGRGGSSRGNLLLKRRSTGELSKGGRKSAADSLRVYEPPQGPLSKDNLMNDFRERLETQKQTVYSPADVDSLDVQAILAEIERNDVTFINTQTGSGKSTLVPRAIMDACDEHRVVTTQPRRTATIRLADTVSSMCGETIGENSRVGYWIRGDRRGGRHTHLWYMTSYTLLLHLLNNRMAPPFTHIIIDEFHERQPEIEVLVALLRLLLQKPRGTKNHFKLVLMSATIGTEEWAQYFAGLKYGLYSNDNQKYVVHDYYLEEASTMCGAALRRPDRFNQAIVNPEMYDNAVYVAQQLIKVLIDESQLNHSILVFLPGRAAVSKLRRWVEATLSHRLWPIPWHGSVELSWIKEQIGAQVIGKQKIYLATDVAEVSITLPDVVFVVDLCLVKRPYIEPTTPSTVLFPQLVQQWCSKGSVEQRRGRVGRTQQGFYFSLLPVEYASKLEGYASPPICNSRLDDLTLHLLHVCASPRALFSLCKRPPISDSMKISIRALLEIGAIEPTTKDDGMLTWSADILEAAHTVDPTLKDDSDRFNPTFIGTILQRLPVGVQSGMLVFYGLVLGLETLSIICAAIVQTAIPFVTISPQNIDEEGIDMVSGAQYEATAQSKERTHRSLLLFSRGSDSDLIACIVVYLEWKKRYLAGEEVDQWAEEMCVSLERLVAIDELVTHLHNEMRSFFPCQSYVTAADGIVDAVSLQKQLLVHQPILLWLICVTFGSNAVQVRQVRDQSRKATRESGTPLFLPRAETYPNAPIPSVATPWRLGQVIVPVSITITEGRNSIAVQQSIPTPQFLLILIMLFPRIRYSSVLHEDSQGTYRAFCVTINGVTRRIRCPASASALVLEFRKQFNYCVSALKYRRQLNHMDDVSFVNYLQEHTTDAIGGCFSLLKARVDLMTQMWCATRDPTSMPTEMLFAVATDEMSVFNPTSLGMQNEAPPAAAGGASTAEEAAGAEPPEPSYPPGVPDSINPSYLYPDFMTDPQMQAAAAASGWAATLAAQNAAAAQAPLLRLSNHASLFPMMQPAFAVPGAYHAGYMQPHQPVSGAPGEPSKFHAPEETADGDDAHVDPYAAFVKSGPLQDDDDSSDDEV